MKNVRVLILCGAVALGACHGDSGQPSADKPTPQRKSPAVANPGPTAAQLTVGMVEAASQGKSQLPVEVKFELLKRPMVGQALEIPIALIAQIAANSADIDIAGADGLDVASGSGQINIPGIEAGQVYRRSVKVTPTADGVLLLALNVTLKHDEITESRTFSLPLIVAASTDGAGSQH
jgi:hypothetical protein